MNLPACPPPDDLLSLLDETLPADQVTLVTTHIESCPDCQTKLETLTDDRILKSFSHRKLDNTKVEEAPEWLIAKLATHGVGQVEKDEVLSFLKPPVVEDELGQLGAYRVKRILGRGGMGVVLHGYDTTLKRHVALKVLWPPPGSAEARSRIFHEAQAVAQVRHDGVVQVHAVHNDPSDPPYLTMEYVPGKTLREHLKQGDVPLPQIAQWCIEIADGLSAAHAAGLIHRDIKPTNILIDEATNKAKLTDFGLARASSIDGGQTRQVLLAGTPAYMSPEQIQHPELVDIRCDIYGLGATLYEALTSAPPFRGPVEGLIRQVMNIDPVSPHRLNLAVPIDLETICMKCLAKEPVQRYTTATELADDLRRYVEGRPILARPLGVIGRLGKAIRRRPVLAVVTALLVASMLIGTAVSMFYWHRAEQNLTLANEKVEAAFRTIDQFCLKVSEDRLLAEAGMQPLRKELLQTAVPELQKLSADKPSDPRLFDKWIKSTYLLAKLRRDIEGPAVALPILNQILPTLKERLHTHPDNVANRRLLVDVLMYEGICRENLRQYEPAIAIWNELETLLKNYDDPADRLLHSRLNINIGKTASDLGDMKKATSYAQLAQDIARRLTVSNPEILEGHYCLATSTGNLASGLARLGQVADAENMFRTSIGHWKKLVDDNTRDLTAQMELLRNQLNLAELFLLSRKFADARTELEAGLPLAEKLIRRFPQSLALRKFHGQFHIYTGLCGHMTGQAALADKHYQSAVDMMERYHHDDPNDIPIYYDLIRAKLVQAYFWHDTRKIDEAARSYSQLLPMLDDYAQKTPEAGAEMKAHSHTVRYSLAMLLSEQGKPADALAEVQKITADDPSNKSFNRLVDCMLEEKVTGKDNTDEIVKHISQFLQECKAAESQSPQTAAMYYLASCCGSRSLKALDNTPFLSAEEKMKLNKELKICILRWLAAAKEYGFFSAKERRETLIADENWKLLHQQTLWQQLVK